MLIRNFVGQWTTQRALPTNPSIYLHRDRTSSGCNLFSGAAVAPSARTLIKGPDRIGGSRHLGDTEGICQLERAIG